MSAYGFDIEVGNDVVAQLRHIEDAIGHLAESAESQTRHIKENFDDLGEGLSSIAELAAGVFAVYEIKEFGEEIFNVTKHFQGFQNIIKFSSKDSADAAANIGYIEDAIGRLHLPMEQAYESFADFSAGLFGTGVEGEKLRGVFEGVSTAASVLHLAPEKFTSVMGAMQQMAELGTVQMDQMRQLALALPGAMNIAAKSIGLTGEKFHEAMSKGKIKASEFLPLFGDELNRQFTPGLANAGHSLQSQENDFTSGKTDLMRSVGTDLEPVFAEMYKDLADIVGRLKDIWTENGKEIVESLTDSLKMVSYYIKEAFDSEPFKYFVTHLKEILGLVVKGAIVWGTYKGVIITTGLVTKAYTLVQSALGAAMATTAVEASGAAAATTAFSGALSSVALGAFGIGLGLVIQKWISLNAEMEISLEKMSHLKELSGIRNDLSKDNNELMVKFFNDQGMTKDQRNQLAGQIGELQKKSADALAMDFAPKIADAESKLIDLRTRAQMLDSKQTLQGKPLSIDETSERSKLVIQMKELTNQISEDRKKQADVGIIAESAKRMGEWYKGRGIGVNDGKGGKPFSNALQQDAINTSSISGGLGSAKNIYVRIDTLQKNNVNSVKEWEKTSENAIEILIRAINNLSYSQTGTM